MESKTESRWTLSSAGNRALLAVLLALIVFVPTRSIWVAVVVGVVVYLLATLVGRYAGTERQP